jgi:hypothetical protein
MRFNSITEIKKWFAENKYADEVHEAINFLLNKVNDVSLKEFVGLEIKDNFCNGFFGKRYDLYGSVIIDVGHDYVTVRKKDKEVVTGYFGVWRIAMREFIEEWTKDKNKEDI